MRLLFFNGKIYTLDEAKPMAQAVAIDGSLIVALGSDKEVKVEIGTGKWESIDLQGRAVVPGFIDCHIHFLTYALGLEQIDLEGVESLEKALDLVAGRVKSVKPGQWISGFGWDHSLWKGFPSKEDLDRVAPENPVALTRKDGHLLWVNSLALREAKIDRETPDPSGGHIQRDEVGEPTGILMERAKELVYALLPQPTAEERRRALLRAAKKAHQVGLTGIHDCEGGEAFGDFQALGERLGLRVQMMIPQDSLEAAIALGLKSGFGNHYLRVGHLKIFANGSLGSQTADMLEPYLGQPDNKGIVVTPEEETRALIERASQNEIACAVHAIGDAANHKVLRAYAEVREKGIGLNLRHRIEHVQLLHPGDVARFGSLGVIASMQPIHATSDMLVADRYWGERARYSYAWRSLLDSGAALAFGSDCPVESLNPLWGLHAAVTRQRADSTPPGGWHPQERLSLPQALRAYTLGAAYASGEEKVKGSIAPGKLADLVVLSRDIFEIPPQEILETEVVFTIFDGNIVYEGGE